MHFQLFWELRQRLFEVQCLNAMQSTLECTNMYLTETSLVLCNEKQFCCRHFVTKFWNKQGTFVEPETMTDLEQVSTTTVSDTWKINITFLQHVRATKYFKCGWKMCWETTAVARNWYGNRNKRWESKCSHQHAHVFFQTTTFWTSPSIR